MSDNPLPRESGIRVFELDKETPRAFFDVSGLDRPETQQMSAANPYLELFPRALSRALALPGQDRAEVRLLRLPALNFEALWLHYDGTNEDDKLIQSIFRDEIHRAIASHFKHIYIFGTAGEGYAVDSRRFEEIVQVFREETAAEDVHALVGIIGLSTVQVKEAGVGSVLPAVSMARTWNVCEPSARPV